MTTDSSFAVQTALYSFLTATAPLTALLAGGAGGIFDHVPAGTPFPYMVLGDISSAPFDTQGVFGNEIIAEIYIYSRAHGMQEMKTILSVLHEALHEADFPVTGQFLILCRRMGAEMRLEDDGETRRAIARFHILTEPQ
jgi:hypothetical protein